MSFTRTSWFVGLENTQDVRQLVNDSGQSGFLKFASSEYEEICQVANIDYDTDITNKPDLFSGNYGDLDNKPSLFSGDYGDLNGKPTILTETQVNDLIDNSALTAGDNITIEQGTISAAVFDKDYNSLDNLPTILTESEVNALIEDKKLTEGDNITITTTTDQQSGVSTNVISATLPTILTNTDVQTLIDTSALFTDNTTNIQYERVQIHEAEVRIISETGGAVPQGYVYHPFSLITAGSSATLTNADISPIVSSTALTVSFNANYDVSDTTILNIDFDENTSLSITKDDTSTSLTISEFGAQTKYPETVATNANAKQSTTLSPFAARLAFNFVVNNEVGQACANDQYTASTGEALFERSFSGYKGDWIMINIGEDEAFVLDKVRFYARGDNSIVRAPGKFKIYGTNNTDLYDTATIANFASTDWKELHNQTDRLTDYVVGTAKEVSISNNEEAYSIYVLVVNQLSGTSTAAHILNFLEWELYGTPVENTTTTWNNSITPNETNHYAYTLGYDSFNTLLSVNLYKNAQILPKTGGAFIVSPFSFPSSVDSTGLIGDSTSSSFLADFNMFDRVITQEEIGFLHDPSTIPPAFSTLVDDVALLATKNELTELIDNIAVVVSYNDLTDLPTLFDNDYNSLDNLPTLFDNDYNSLDNLPTLFDNDYNSLDNLPTILTETQVNDLIDDNKLTEGDNITISATNVISAVLPTILTETQVNALIDDNKLTEGDNITISATNVISAVLPTILTETQVNGLIDDNKLTEGDNITISATNVISAVLPTILTETQVNGLIDDNKLTAGDNIEISAGNVISATVFSGSYNDLDNLPTLFDNDYNSLDNLPTLFDNDYNSLDNLPTLFDNDYNSLDNLPTLFDNDYNSLDNLPTLFDNDYNSLDNLPTILTETDVQTLIDTSTPPSFFTDNGTNIQYNNIQIHDSEIRVVVPDADALPQGYIYEPMIINTSLSLTNTDIDPIVSSTALTVSFNASYANTNNLNILFIDFDETTSLSITKDDTSTSLTISEVGAQTKYPKDAATNENSKQSTSFPDSSLPARLAFNFVVNNEIGQACNRDQYALTTGEALFERSFAGYKGDWIMINIGEAFVLNEVRFYMRADLSVRAPGLFKIYGTNNTVLYDTPNFTSTDWKELHNQTTKLTGYVAGTAKEVSISNNEEAYSIYVLVVNRLSGSDHILNFLEWELYGTTVENTTTTWNNSITPNETNHYAYTLGYDNEILSVDLYKDAQLLPKSQGEFSISAFSFPSSANSSGLIGHTSLTFEDFNIFDRVITQEEIGFLHDPSTIPPAFTTLVDDVALLATKNEVIGLIDNVVVSYNDLTDLPTLFDNDYNSLDNLPTLFDNDYNSLDNLPTLFDNDYNSLDNKLTAGTNITIENNEISASTVSVWEENLIIANPARVDVYKLDCRVGINVAVPEYPLDVAGDINYTGTLLKDGVDILATLSGDYNDLDNKLTAGDNIEISANNVISASTQWTTSGTTINYTTGSVGIGTTFPTQILDVSGNSQLLGRININNATDGGTTRGIMMWSPTDTNWGIYMGQSGAGKSFSGGNACSGVNFTQHAIRFRVANSGNQGFIFENGAEELLLSIAGNDGTLCFKTNTWHTSTDGEQRLRYTNLGRTIYKGRGAVSHTFRNYQDEDLLHIGDTGRVRFINNVWHGTIDGKQRVYYESNSHTYYQGHGTIPHIWRNTSDADIMDLEGTGRLRVDVIRSRGIDLGLQSSKYTGNHVFLHSNGDTFQGNNSSSWAISSDERIKQDIEEANYEMCYENISNLSLKRYMYRDGIDCIKSNDIHRLGFIAQEVQPIFPKSVNTREVCICDADGVEIEKIEDCLSIDVEHIHMSLYGAFKHSQKKILELETKLKMVMEHLNLQ